MAQYQQPPYNQGPMNQPPAGRDPYGQHRSEQFQYPKRKSAMAITALVLGIVALLTSFLPIINNLSFILGLLGVIFAIIGLVGIMRGKKSGKGIAIAALIITVLSCVIVLATQSMYSAAIDEATTTMENPAVSSSTSDAGASNTESADEANYTDLAIGTTVDFSNGLSVTVNSFESGIENYDGSELTAISVTYVNNGDSEASFNVFDWESQDASGVVTAATFYGSSDDDLNSGTLVSGGSITGTVYLQGDAEKVIYTSSLFSDTTYSWVLA